MSINDIVDDVEDVARLALIRTKAITVCPIHHDVTIRQGDHDAERHAYAYATTILKGDGTTWMREEVMDAIKSQLDQAADWECPICEGIADD